MTQLQQVLFELDAPYFGHPYYVTGHAIFSAIGRHLDDETHRSLHVSNGVFVPESVLLTHSRSGGDMGAGLRPVVTYEDLFIYRDAAQYWLQESPRREVHNTHDLQRHDGRLAFASTTQFGAPAETRTSKQTMSWYIQCYLHDDSGDDGPVPLDEKLIDGLRLGGGRNYGFGEVSLVETQLVDLEALDFSRVREADAHQIELVSPYVLQSGYPGADSQSVPSWWEYDGRLRRRIGKLVTKFRQHDLAMIDHGQIVTYAGDRPVETARNGVLRVGTHSKIGFGEIRVRPIEADRVSDRHTAEAESRVTDDHTAGVSCEAVTNRDADAGGHQ